MNMYYSPCKTFSIIPMNYIDNHLFLMLQSNIIDDSTCLIHLHLLKDKHIINCFDQDSLLYKQFMEFKFSDIVLDLYIETAKENNVEMDGLVETMALYNEWFNLNKELYGNFDLTPYVARPGNYKDC